MKLKDVAYDIEKLYIDGFAPTRIAKILDIPLGLVYDWLEEQNVAGEPQVDSYDPYDTVGS